MRRRPAPGLPGWRLRGEPPLLADFALINSGSIRAGLRKGPVTWGDVCNIEPFESRVCLLEVSGRELLRLLEHGFGFLPAPDGAFPQISGLRLTVRPGNPPGSRVLRAEVPQSPCTGFKALELDKWYLLAVNDFLAAGGDGYPIPVGRKILRDWMPLRQALIRRINENSAAYSDAAPVRIIFVP